MGHKASELGELFKQRSGVGKKVTIVLDEQGNPKGLRHVEFNAGARPNCIDQGLGQLNIANLSALRFNEDWLALGQSMQFFPEQALESLLRGLRGVGVQPQDGAAVVGKRL